MPWHRDHKSKLKKKKKIPLKSHDVCLMCMSLDWVRWIPDIPSVAQIIPPFGGG